MRIRALVAAAVLLACSAVAQGPAGDAVINSVGMTMVLLPPGSFTMGSPPGTPMRQEEEAPRRVTLTRRFRISASEVTQKQWDAVMGDSRAAGKGDLPVSSVSWREAREFCARLSQKESASYRLPTEAEWEYACRAGEPAPQALDSIAWYSSNSDGALHPVGRKAANAWGLYDMLGNAAEWTQDAYAPYPALADESDPRGPAAGATRVVRGGAFRSFAPAVRCAARTATGEAYQQPHVGFRVVQEAR